MSETLKKKMDGGKIRYGSVVNQIQAVLVDANRYVGRAKSSLHNLQQATTDWSDGKVSDSDMKNLLVKLLGEAQDELDKIVDGAVP